MMTPPEEIEVFAQGLREELGLSKIGALGDLKKIIRHSGIGYVEESWGNEFAAFSRYLGNEQFLIGFNSDQNHTPGFYRFTLAHELGHITLPHHRELLKTMELHRSDHDDMKEIEREANHFAISFLCPYQDFFGFMKQHTFEIDYVFYLAKEYGVSLEATALRMLFCSSSPAAVFYLDASGKIAKNHTTTSFSECIQEDVHVQIQEHIGEFASKYNQTKKFSIDGHTIHSGSLSTSYKNQTMVLLEIVTQN